MASTEATPEVLAAAPKASVTGFPQIHALLTLAWKGALLFAATLLTALGVVWAIPDGNDYALASRLKHDRLAAIASRKIVLVGGSNLAYGIDSARIEEETGCPVVNMGMNGYLGVRLLLNEVAPDIRRGDIVVMAFEYDNYFKSVNGAATDQLMIEKAFPPLATRLTLRQQLMILKAVPFVAQQKILRLMEDTYVKLVPSAYEPMEVDIVGDIETLKGFTPEGDLVSHLGVTWNEPREDGLDASTLPLDTQAIDLMRNFSERMRDRGADVIVSYTPVIEYYYDQHKLSLDALGERIRATPSLVAPSTPRDYVYGQTLFFDTVYHLNAEGRELRTRRLIDDLRRQLHERATCGPSTGQGVAQRGSND